MVRKKWHKSYSLLCVSLLFLAVFLTISITWHTMAESSTYFTDGDTCRANSPTGGAGPIKNACDKCFASGGSRYGTVWINQESSNRASSDHGSPSGVEYKDHSDEDNPDSATQKITAYLHGAFINCTDSVDTLPTGMNAWHLNFITPKSGTANSNSEAYHQGAFNNNWRVDFIEDLDGQLIKNEVLNRSDGSTNVGVHEWGTLTSSVHTLAFNINLKKLYDYSKDPATSSRCSTSAEDYGGGLTSITTCSVGIWRCPRTSGAINDQCWANNEEITIYNYSLGGFRGQTKIKKPRATTGEEEDDDAGGSKFENLARHNYDGDVDLGTMRTNTGYVVVPNYVSNYAYYEEQIETTKTFKRRINFSLRQDGVGSTTPYYLYVGTKELARGNFTSTDLKAKNIKSYNLCAKYAGKVNGKATFNFRYGDPDGSGCRESRTTPIDPSNVYNGDTVCFTLRYLSREGGNDKVTRTVCYKAKGDNIVDESSQGLINFKGGKTSSSASLPSGQKTAGYEDGSSTTQTVDPLIFSEDSKDVYAQFEYKVKISSAGTRYNYKIIGCDTDQDSSDYKSNCKAWIADAGGSTSENVIESGNNKTLSGNNTEAIITTENSSPFSRTIQRDHELTICRKLFVKSGTADWNTSTACIDYSATGEGDRTAKATVSFNEMQNPGVSALGDMQCSSTASDPENACKITLTGGSSAQVRFIHTITGGGQGTPKQGYRVYHREGDATGVMSKEGNVAKNINANLTLYSNSDGYYTLTAGGGEICESVWLKKDGVWHKGKVCAELMPDPPIINSTNCSSPISATVESGTSYSESYVLNRNNTNYNRRILNGSIYAKPGDIIEFDHCYYPGAHAVRTTVKHDMVEEPEEAWPLGTTDQGKTTANQITPAPTKTMKESDFSGTHYIKVPATQTLIEADYVSGGYSYPSTSSTNYYYIDTSYPGGYTGSLTNGSIAMEYLGNGYSGGTRGASGGSPNNNGAIYPGEALSKPTVQIGPLAAGGTLSQTVNSYAGTLTRKEHAATWQWNFYYYFTKCGKKNGKLDPDNCDSTAVGTNGVATGTHENKYYEKNSSASDYGFKYNTSSASVYIPYNFTNTASVSIDTATKIYAGEAFHLSDSTVNVGPRYNSTTQGTYATVAPNITTRLYAFVSRSGDVTGQGSSGTSGTYNGDGCSYYGSISNGQCAQIDSDTRTFNQSGNTSGSSESVFSDRTYNAFDVPAGSYLCVGLGMNPYTTYDTSINTSSYYYTSVSCAKVYKKPIFAVWGGNVFSNGSILANKMDKRVIANYYQYTPRSNAYHRIFTSWAESTIISNALINGLASGAATAYTSAGNSSTGYAPIAAPGGLRTMDECDIHRLSIANEQCGRGRAGNADFGNQTAVKEEIIRRFIEPTKQKTAFTDTTVTLSSKHLDEGQTFYTHLSSENVELTATSLEYGTTHIVAAEGNITITGNITLPDVFASPSQVPQYIIYAEKDINIIGDVTEINAILIANGNINTCSRGACTKQLRINGSLSANKIFLNRTYGAGIGANSLVPAEIINYDPSLFMWSGMMGSREINQSITETYIRELAPRQ